MSPAGAGQQKPFGNAVFQFSLSITKAELNRWEEDRVRRISSSFPIVNVFSEPTIFSLQIRPDLPRWIGIRSMMSP